MIQIQRLDADPAAYDSYLLRHPGSLLYQSSRYRRLLGRLLECEDHTLVAVEGGSIRGVLPLMRAEGESGKVYNSLPYYGSNGGVLADDGEVVRRLVAAYDDLALAEETAAATTVENPFVPFDASALAHNLADERIAQFTELSAEQADEEALLRCVDGSARRNVAKAVRSGVTVAVDNGGLARLHEIHHANITAAGGLAKNRRFFELVPEIFRPGQDFDVYVARREGRVIASLLVFYFNRTVEYFTPAIEHSARPLQPLSLVIATAMRAAAASGFGVWNWGGTWPTQTSLYRFKRKWAARELRYANYTQLNDRGILGLTPAEITARYPGFFVAPFSALVHSEVTAP
jgi:hypothetical protein